MAELFDETELLERVDNDIGFLGETVEMLQSDGRSLLAELKTALSANDSAAVGRVAHALKGMISNFCAPIVQQLALDAEKAGKSGDCSAAAPAVAALEPKLESLINELQAFVQARS